MDIHSNFTSGKTVLHKYCCTSFWLYRTASAARALFPGYLRPENKACAVSEDSWAGLPVLTQALRHVPVITSACERM